MSENARLFQTKWKARYHSNERFSLVCHALSLLLPNLALIAAVAIFDECDLLKDKFIGWNCDFL